MFDHRPPDAVARRDRLGERGSGRKTQPTDQGIRPIHGLQLAQAARVRRARHRPHLRHDGDTSRGREMRPLLGRRLAMGEG
jgi:hypothetical protein